MKISKKKGGGDGVALPLAYPMFRFPGVKRGDGVFSLVSWHVLLVFWRGGGGMVGYEVATLGVMLLAMVLMLAGGAKPGQC